MLVVYQMSKVASQSWLELLQASPLPGAAQCHFVHAMAAGPRAATGRALGATGIWQTIGSRFMMRHNDRRNRAAVEALQQPNRGAVKIVTGMREPVARSISLLFYLIDLFVPVGVSRCAMALTADELCAYLIAAWQGVFVDAEPISTFDWVLRHTLDHYRSWFDAELEEMFGIDLLQEPFRPEEGAQRVRQDDIDVIAYRTEDMREGAAAYPALLDQASEFVGMPVTGFPAANSGERRRSHALYEEVKVRVRFPSALLDQIYTAPSVRHFYRPYEIADFRRKWTAA